MYYSFAVLLDIIGYYFVKDLYIHIHEEYLSAFSCGIFIGLWYQNYAGLIK